MLDFLYHVQWDQAQAFLASGSPPMYVRLLGLNALFLGLYGIRRYAGVRPMGPGLTLCVQLAILGANVLMLYQPEIEDYVRSLRVRF